jgi:hypothetical protein
MLTVQWQFDPATRNGDNYGGLMTAWGLGLQHFPDHVAGRAGQGDWWGHLGEAYGLLSGMLFERERRFGYIYLIGGVGADPDSQRGRVSAFSRWEEEIQIAIRQAFIDWQCGGEASPGG